MTKREFIRTMIEDTGILREDALKITDIVFSHVRNMLLAGREVRVDGVGSFVLRFRKGGVVNNNLVGESHEVGPRVKLKFKTFPSMRRDLNQTLVEGS